MDMCMLSSMKIRFCVKVFTTNNGLYYRYVVHNCNGLGALGIYIIFDTIIM